MIRSPQNQPESFWDAASESRDALPLAVTNEEMSENSIPNVSSQLTAALPELELDFSSDTSGDALSLSSSTTKPPEAIEKSREGTDLGALSRLIGDKPGDLRPSVPKSSVTTAKPGEDSEKSREELGGSLSNLLRERSGDAKPAVPPSPLAPTTYPPEANLPPVKPEEITPPILEFPSGPVKPAEITPPKIEFPSDPVKPPDLNPPASA